MKTASLFDFPTMRVFRDQLFQQITSADVRTFDHQFVRCAFMHCKLLGGEDPAKRALIQRALLHDCRISDCGIQRAVIEDTIVDNLQMEGRDPLMIWGCVFKHLVLRGQFGSININKPYTSSARREEAIERGFAEADERYYNNVDWAIDIRDAQVLGLRIRGVPTHLIRRDSLTQAVVKRQQIVEQKWASLDLGNSWWKSILSAESRKPGGDVVLVAPKLDESFEVQLEAIRRLRSAGIANSD